MEKRKSQKLSIIQTSKRLFENRVSYGFGPERAPFGTLLDTVLDQRGPLGTFISLLKNNLSILS